jgi:hypothetical protein
MDTCFARRLCGHSACNSLEPHQDVSSQAPGCQQRINVAVLCQWSLGLTVAVCVACLVACTVSSLLENVARSYRSIQSWHDSIFPHSAPLYPVLSSCPWEDRHRLPVAVPLFEPNHPRFGSDRGVVPGKIIDHSFFCDDVRMMLQQRVEKHIMSVLKLP